MRKNKVIYGSYYYNNVKQSQYPLNSLVVCAVCGQSYPKIYLTNAVCYECLIYHSIGKVEDIEIPEKANELIIKIKNWLKQDSFFKPNRYPSPFSGTIKNIIKNDQSVTFWYIQEGSLNECKYTISMINPGTITLLRSEGQTITEKELLMTVFPFYKEVELQLFIDVYRNHYVDGYSADDLSNWYKLPRKSIYDRINKVNNILKINGCKIPSHPKAIAHHTKPLSPDYIEELDANLSNIHNIDNRDKIVRKF